MSSRRRLRKYWFCFKEHVLQPPSELLQSEFFLKTLKVWEMLRNKLLRIPLVLAIFQQLLQSKPRLLTIKLFKWLRAWLWLLPYLKADDDFLLRIAPLHNRKSQAWRDYYPPPRYGIPPNQHSASKHQKQYEKYGLFLWPGKVARQFLISSLLIFLFVPLIFLTYIQNGNYFSGAAWSASIIATLIFLSWFITVYFNANYFTIIWQKHGGFTGLAYIGLTLLVVCTINTSLLFGGIYYFSLLILFIMASWLVFIFLYWRAPTVLSNIWSSWSKAQDTRFANVPHKSDLAFNDISKEKIPPYWQPDSTTIMQHQTSVYAKSTRSLQEVLLHFAIFDFLFENEPNKQKKPKKRFDDDYTDCPKKDQTQASKNHIAENIKENTPEQIQSQPSYTRYIKSNIWLMYFFSPVWISFLVLMVAFCTYALMSPHPLNNDYGLIVQFPYGFIIPLVVWGITSLIFVANQRQFLMKLHDDIKREYFDAHLERVPQQVLNALPRIPNEMHIKSGIEEMDKVQGIVQTVAIIVFLAMMEIFSSGYSEPQPDCKSAHNQPACHDKTS